MFIWKKQQQSNWIQITTNVIIIKKNSKTNDDIKPKSPHNLKRYMKKKRKGVENTNYHK
jgi:hypothetical protein